MDPVFQENNKILITKNELNMKFSGHFFIPKLKVRENKVCLYFYFLVFCRIFGHFVDFLMDPVLFRMRKDIM